ncbi:MAG: Superoxide dismutase [Bacteroidota bacterium]
MKSLSTLLFTLMTGFICFSQTFKLPDLPFGYLEYEPFIDAKTMEIHHSKHHQSYINNLNKAVSGTKMETRTLEQLLLNVSNYSDAIRNNSGGHYNHSLFWEILSPKSSSQPNEELLKAIEESFGKLDSLKTKLHQAAMSRFGSGWAWLIVNVDGKLQVTITGNQDNPLMDVVAERGIPILGIDVWEHAYYLKHQNKRNDYIYAIFSMLNWDVISQKYKDALGDPNLKIIRSDNWPELKEFHKVMSATFHAAEKADFKPIQERNNELMVKAYILKNSEIPVLNSTELLAMYKSLSKLEKQTTELHTFLMIGKKITNEMIFKKLTAIHDTFHEIAGLCKE